MLIYVRKLTKSDIISLVVLSRGNIELSSLGHINDLSDRGQYGINFFMCLKIFHFFFYLHFDTSNLVNGYGYDWLLVVTHNSHICKTRLLGTYLFFPLILHL